MKVHTRVNIIVVSLITTFMCLIGAEASFHEKTFENPTVNSYALDFCRNWAANCGWPAAHAYCKEEGYWKAANFKWRQDSPPTRVINGGQLCNQPTCDRIISVTCTRSGQRID